MRNGKWNSTLKRLAEMMRNENYDSAGRLVYEFIFESEYDGPFSPKMQAEVEKVVNENAVSENANDRFADSFEYYNEMGA